MKKYGLAILLTGALAFGGGTLAIQPAKAASEHQVMEKPGEKDLSQKRKADWEKKLKEKAEKHGIDTKGKSAEQLHRELRSHCKEKHHMDWGKRAQELGINTEGLSKEEIKKAVRAKVHEKLVAKAKSLGINTEGLDFRELHRAIKEKERQNQ